MHYFLFISLFLLAQVVGPEWNLRKNKSGIKVYTRSVEGSKFDEFKGVTVIEHTTLPAVLELLLDVKSYDLLFPDCMNPKVLKQEGKWHDIHYIQTKGPFPVKDRDSVFEQKTIIDKDGKHAVITLIALPDYIPENKEMVRIRKGSGFWDLEEDSAGNVKVTYQFQPDPAGEVPSWLANSFVETHPYKTLNNLKSRLIK